MTTVIMPEKKKGRGRKPFPRDEHGNIIRPDGTIVQKKEKKERKPRKGSISETSENSPFKRIEVREQTGKWVDYVTVFENIPSDLTVNKQTTEGTRLIVARYTDRHKFFLRKFYKKGDVTHKGHDGTEYKALRDYVVCYNSFDDCISYFRTDAVIVHPGGHVQTENKAYVNLTPHKPGTAAHERAERKLERLRKKQEKIAAKEAKKAAKEAKIKAKIDKKVARIEKKRMKEEKKKLKRN